MLAANVSGQPSSSSSLIASHQLAQRSQDWHTNEFATTGQFKRKDAWNLEELPSCSSSFNNNTYYCNVQIATKLPDKHTTRSTAYKESQRPILEHPIVAALPSILHSGPATFFENPSQNKTWTQGVLTHMDRMTAACRLPKNFHHD